MNQKEHKLYKWVLKWLDDAIRCGWTLNENGVQLRLAVGLFNYFIH